MADTNTTAAQPAKKSKIQERIDAKRRDLAKAQGLLSEDDRTEQSEREELARVEAEEQDAKRAARDLDLARRLDDAREKTPGGKFGTVLIEGYDDSFIVKLNGIAYKKWDKTINDAASNAKIDPQEERRKLVAASMVDWNGETDFGPTGLAGGRLLIWLGEHQGCVAPLIQEILVLNGVMKETRKSTG
jgi:hypothetical protein